MKVEKGPVQVFRPVIITLQTKTELLEMIEILHKCNSSSLSEGAYELCHNVQGILADITAIE